jgi:hypothetical protein
MKFNPMQSRNRGRYGSAPKTASLLRLGVVSLHMVQHELTDSLASIRADALVACVAQSNGHVSGVR